MRGSIAKNDPEAEDTSECIALKEIIQNNNRKINAENFFRGMVEKCIKKTEIIETIEVEIPQKSNYQKLPNPASRYAIVGVYVAKHKTGINVAVTGAKACVYNDKDLAGTLKKDFSSSAIDKVKISSSGMNSDIHASADYRANMVKVFAKKAVDAC